MPIRRKHFWLTNRKRKNAKQAPRVPEPYDQEKKKQKTKRKRYKPKQKKLKYSNYWNVGPVRGDKY